MNVQNNSTVQIAQSFFEAMESNNYNAWAANLAEDYVGDYPGLVGANRAMAQTFNSVFSIAFPDLRFEIKHTDIVGDRVIFEWSGVGTHTGPLATQSGQVIPPTGKPGKVNGVLISQVKDGKIVSEKTYWDQMELMKQLGLM